MSSESDRISRREFLSTCMKTGSALAVSGAFLTGPVIDPGGRVLGANDQITTAVAGINGQGSSHFNHFSMINGVRVKTICEVDERLYEEKGKWAEDLTGNTVQFEPDIRTVLDDPDIDAISIATPNHWHSLMTVWGCQAGKDVYVEKPISHNVWEGRRAVEAARRYQRVVAAGTQYRTYPHIVEAMRLLHEGVIGDVYMAKGLCYKPRESISEKMDTRAPEGLHYDLWLGPAPLQQFNPNYVHYNWHWFWDFGNGDIGNQGVHEMDLARWGLDKKSLPTKIYSDGGYYAFDSDQQTPNTQHATFKWDDGKILQFEVRGLYTNGDDEIRIGNLYYGTEGWMHLDQEGYSTYLGRDNEPGPSGKPVVKKGVTAIGGPAGFEEGAEVASSRLMHRINFIEAVRAGDPSHLNADILTGHISSSLCHLANISYRVGRNLEFDPYTERFVDDDQANGYLKRDYRYPFEVPESFA
ncbi:MAG TPA: Gfo/Idh/MocA family oxidoreductase [bacterium]|nr:Gfo/Idh/MocA family oxidoreductase [bacterium]